MDDLRREFLVTRFAAQLAGLNDLHLKDIELRFACYEHGAAQEFRSLSDEERKAVDLSAYARVRDVRKRSAKA